MQIGPRPIHTLSMWTPDSAALSQLKGIFQGILSSNNTTRRQANEALEQARQQPEYENYLFQILVMDNTAKSDVRAGAGVNLKNSIMKKSGNRQFLLDNILQGLLVEDSMVRNITGNVITSLFSIYKLSGWPQVLPQLLELAKREDFVAEAAMSALSKICEDSFYDLDMEYNGERPLTFMIEQFLKLMVSNSASVRANAIGCVNNFIPLKSQLFLVHLDEFLARLFGLAQDLNDEVKKKICVAFGHVLETRPDKLIPHLDGVIDYCLHLMEDTEEVALEACEFLLAMAEEMKDNAVFTPKLGLIVPTLLDKMVYSEEEIFLMGLVDEKDTTVVDRDEDIKPRAAKSKEAHGSRDDSDDDSDDDDDDDELDQWSLRKCSAATLDTLSTNSPGEILYIALPILQEKIVSPEWPIREASILAFGAISKSCIELSRDKLPSLVPFLVDRLQDTEPRVRQITCWTLSRYATWVSEEAHEGGDYSSYFQPTFQSIVTCALDNKKVVQEAACSALSSFIEESDSSLIEFYLEPLLNHFANCFKSYQRKNLIILYDCIQTFVEKMGYDLIASNEKYVHILLPPLMTKWQELSDDDVALWPLLECMASVAATLREIFAPFAVQVYQRAFKILNNCIELDHQGQSNPLVESPEKDFIVTSLDLIDGLVQGLGNHSIELIDSNLIQLVLLCFEDFNTDVRQSAYALLGDLAIFCLEALKPHLNSIFISIGNEINNRTFNTYPVYNNAIWALGEMGVRLQYSEMSPYLNNLIGLLTPLLNSNDIQQTVLENTAICLGRMGECGAGELSPRLSEFIVQWCTQMLNLVENEEKETAFKGMIKIIHGNPDQGFGGLDTQQGKKNLSMFIVCIVNYQNPTAELYGLFKGLLDDYKGLLGPVWVEVLNFVGDENRELLSERYVV